MRIHNRNETFILLIIEIAHKYKLETQIPSEKNDTISLTVSDTIGYFLEEVEQMKSELGLNEYSFSVKQIKDILLKLIQTKESQNQFSITIFYYS
jgi:hypothetical protein